MTPKSSTYVALLLTSLVSICSHAAHISYSTQRSVEAKASTIPNTTANSCSLSTSAALNKTLARPWFFNHTLTAASPDILLGSRRLAATALSLNTSSHKLTKSDLRVLSSSAQIAAAAALGVPVTNSSFLDTPRPTNSSNPNLSAQIIGEHRTAYSTLASSTTLRAPGTSSRTPSPLPTLAVLPSTTPSHNQTQTLQYLQADGSNSTAVFDIQLTTTITSLPSSFSTISVSQVSSDTTSIINGTVFPVLYTGANEGILLAGLGFTTASPKKPTRPGCNLKGLLAIFQTFVPCGAVLWIPRIGYIVIDPRGIPRLIESSPTPGRPKPAVEPIIIPDPPSPYGPPADSGENDGDGKNTNYDKKTRVTSAVHETSTMTTSSILSSGTTSSTFSKQSSTSVQSSSASGTPGTWLIYPSATPAPNPSSLRTFLQQELGSNSFREMTLLDGDLSEDTIFSAAMNGTTAAKLANRTDLISAVEPNDDIYNSDGDYPTEEGSYDTSSASCVEGNLTRRSEITGTQSDHPDTASSLRGEGESLAGAVEKRLLDYVAIPQYNGVTPGLRFASQFRNNPSLEDFVDYVFLDKAGPDAFTKAPGERAPLYILHYGADSSNLDFMNMKGSTRWLWPDRAMWEKYSDLPYLSETDPNGRGSCTASIASGWWYGLAKKADVVIVPLPYKDTKKEKYLVKADVFIQMTLLVQDDIRREQEADPLYAPVVLIPREFDRPGKGTVREYETNKLLGKSTTKKVIEALRGLVALHATVVTGAGNWKTAKKANVETPPGIYALPAVAAQEFDAVVPGIMDTPGIPELIVVGGVYAEKGSFGYGHDKKREYFKGGEKMKWSRDDPIIDVWAPGFLVTCANGTGRGNQEVSSTEYAAAYTAALAVYLISIYRQEYWNQVTPQYSFPEIVKDSVLIRAWSRNGGPSAIANGLSGHKEPQSEISPWIWAIPGTQVKRDGQSDQSQDCLGNSTVQSSNFTSSSISLTSPSASPSDRSKFSPTAAVTSGAAATISAGATKPEQTTSNSTEVSLHSSTAQETAILATTSTPIMGIPRSRQIETSSLAFSAAVLPAYGESQTSFPESMASVMTSFSTSPTLEASGVATAGPVSPPQLHIPVCNVKGWWPWEDSCIENCDGGVCTGFGTNQNEPPIWQCSHCPKE